MRSKTRCEIIVWVVALVTVAAASGQEVAPGPQEDQRPGLVVTSAVTEGSVKDGLAWLNMSIKAQSYVKGKQRVLLFPAGLAIVHWSVNRPMFGPDAYVQRGPDGVEFVVEGKGKFALSLEAVGRVEEERLRRKVTLPIVPALVARTELTVPGRDLVLEAQPPLGMETKVEGDSTRVSLYGGAGTVELSWAPKPPEKVLKPIVFAEQTIGAHIGQGIMRVTSAVDYSIVQGSVGKLELLVPADCSLLNIEGADLRTWDVAEGGEGQARTLSVTLLEEVKERCRLTLTLEKVLPDVEMEVDLPSVEPLGVLREKGQVAVSAARDIRVEAARMENISPVDVREMAAVPGAQPDEVRLAFRYLKRPFRLSLRTGAVVAKISAELMTLVRAGMDSMRLTTDLRYTIRDAGVFQFQVGMGEGLRLVDIEGPDINNWQLDEAARVLTVALRAKAEGSYNLRVETELDVAGAAAAIPPLQALGVDREVGYVAVVPAPAMKVETGALSGISQIDVKELPQELLQQSPALAFRYIRPGYQLAVNVSAIEPEVQAEVQTVVRLQEHELNLDTEIHYSIRRAGIFQLRVAVPKDLRRTNVEGEDIDDTSWDEEAGILTVNLRSMVTGSYVLKIGTEKTLEDIAQGVELPVIQTVGVKKEGGFIAVATEASVRVKPAEGLMEGLDDIGVSDLPPELLRRAGEVAVAFKYFSQPWRLSLAVERIEPRVTADVFNLLSIGEKLLTVSATVSYTIQHAGVDSFSVKLPPGATAVDTDGDSIKHREEDATKGTWTITLQSKRTGSYNLYVSFQQKLAADESVIPYIGVEVLGVQRETGYLSVTSRADVELSVAGADIENLSPIDSREIPQDYMRGVTVPVLLAFRYVSHPYMLNIGALTHVPAEVTVAVVESAHLSTTVSEEGNMHTDMVCVLRNSRQQYLSLKLPPDARIWHAFVRREPVTPLRDGEVTKIPVAQGDEDGGAFEVRLRYSDRRTELLRAGSIRLESPLKAIDVMRLGWTLSLPEGYELVRDTGNIRRVEGERMLEQQLQELRPDVELEVQVRSRPSVQGAMDTQAWFNARAIEGSQAQEQSGAARNPFVYTGSRPQQRNRFVFQSLIVSSREPAWLEVQYVKSSVGIPLKGAVVAVVALLCGLLWKWLRARRLAKVGLVLGCALVALGVRTLAEDAYRDYLTTILLTLVAVAVLMFHCTVGAWVTEARRHARARRDSAKASEASGPPLPAGPGPEVPQQQAP